MSNHSSVGSLGSNADLADLGGSFDSIPDNGARGSLKKSIDNGARGSLKKSVDQGRGSLKKSVDLGEAAGEEDDENEWEGESENAGPVNPEPPVEDEEEWWGEDAPPEEKLYQTIDDENVIVDAKERPDALVKIFRYIDENDKVFIENLREAVSIRSVSAWTEARNECYRMIQFATTKLQSLGFEIDIRNVGNQEVNGNDIALPPILLATRGTDANKKTLLIYGHLDVQPAKITDGWYCEPFYLTEEAECLYGRGASDDKGPVLGWFHAIEAYVKSQVRLPINIKFILESMEECGSDGLEALLKSQKDGFLSGVDLVTISDNYWLGKSQPCLTYGLRGLCYFFMEVECGCKDLHSGVFGGSVREAMPDLIWLMNQLTAPDGTILIPGLMDDVCPLLPEEQELYKNIDFNIDDFKTDAGIRELRFPKDKNATLMNRWRFPALSIHGIQGAFGEPGARTVIPRKVIGKFSIRIVPNQIPDTIEQLVRKYVKEKWEELGSPNKMRIYMADDGMRPWCANPFHPSFKAARQAVGWAYGKIPDMIREGGTLERVLAFQEVTGKNVLLLPMGSCDDNAHAPNEKINRANYINGTKVFAAYIHEVGKLNKDDL